MQLHSTLLLSNAWHCRSPLRKSVPGSFMPYLSTHQHKPRFRPREGLHWGDTQRAEIMSWPRRVVPSLRIKPHPFQTSDAIPMVGSGSCSVLSAHPYPCCYPSPGFSDSSPFLTTSFRMLAAGQMTLGAISKATHFQMCLEMLAATPQLTQQRRNFHPSHPG